MKEESLKIVFNNVFDAINNSNINELDKIELLLNLREFLDPKQYNTNIKILKKGCRK